MKTKINHIQAKVTITDIGYLFLLSRLTYISFYRNATITQNCVTFSCISDVQCKIY